MDRGALDAVLVQHLGHAVGAMLGAGEDDHSVEAVLLDEVHEELCLLLTAHRVDALLDELDRRVGGRHFDAHRVMKGRAHDAHDVRGHRGREEQVLPLGGDGLDDLADLRPEAHVEHPIGLVQDEDLDVAEVRDPALHQVEQTTGGCDEHVDPTLERLGLRLVAHAAVHDGHPVLGVLGHLEGDLLDLAGEFARGGDHERTGAARLGRDALHQRQHERCGLAGAGLGTAHDVAAFEYHRDRIALDGGRAGVAHGCHGLEKAWRKTQIVETQVELLPRAPCQVALRADAVVLTVHEEGEGRPSLG